MLTWASHLRQLMDERDLRYQQRFDAQNLALEAARMSIKEGTERALASMNGRLELLNELRTGVATSEQLEALEKLLISQSNRIQVLETTRAAGQAQIRSIYAALGAVLVIVSLVVLFANGRL